MNNFFENWRRTLKEAAAPCDGSVVIFMSGAPGSGKSTVINALPKNFPVINPDVEFEAALANAGISANMQGMSDRRKELRAALEEGEPTPERKEEIEQEINKINSDFSTAMKLMYQANHNVEQRISNSIKDPKCLDFLVDGTGASPAKMELRVNALKDRGYKVGLIFVDSDQEAAVQRNLDRSKKGGRSLPTKIVISTHEKVRANKELYSKMFGDNFIYLNNTGTPKDLSDATRAILKDHPLFKI